MTLQSSGTIQFSQIETEFGQISGTGNRKIGGYRISETIGGLIDLPIDAGVPQPGSPISFSDFYSKRCNIVVDCYTSDENRVEARNKYDANDLQVVGPGTKTPPAAGTGTKILIHVNKNIGSQAVSGGSQSYCALRTGTWDSETDAEGCLLQVDVGASGTISGAGGDGGSSTECASMDPRHGEKGNSALGIQHNPTTVNVMSGGLISCGYGGGGAGGSSRNCDEGCREGEGGAGGGGAGIPAGSAGAGPGGNTGSPGTGGWKADDGSTPTGAQTDGGNGGAGSWNDHWWEAWAGVGGAGGPGGYYRYTSPGGYALQDPGDYEEVSGPENGYTAPGKNNTGCSASGGTAGADGAAIRRVSGYTVNINNSGTIDGSQSATEVL